MDAVISDVEELNLLGVSPFRLQAYSVSINKALVLKGGDVEIIARIIKFEDSGSIDVSGEDGLSKGTAAAAEGQFAPGNNGDIGNPGKSGGSIRLICEELIGNVRLVASGGRGGGGQNGSNGRQGQPGRDVQGKRGGDGGQGFAAGAGGQGGVGGSGGSIYILALTSEEAVIDGALDGGAGGEMGLHGTPGPGGPGGDGYITVGGRGRDAGEGEVTHQYGSAGPPGPVPPDPPSSTPGNKGTLSPGQGATRSDLDKVIAQGALPQYWAYLLKSAEQQYYDRAYEEAANRVAWILIGAKSAQESTSSDKPQASTAISTIVDTRTRAALLERQLSLGLDYFALAQNYVPVLSIGEYEIDNSRLADSGKNMEKALATLRQVEIDQDAKKRAANLVVNEANAQIEAIQADATSIPEQQDVLLTSIDELQVQHFKAKQDVIDSLSRLNASLAGGCGLGTILAVAGAVISCVSTAGSTSGLIVAALSSASRGLPTGDDGQPASLLPTAGFIGNAKIFVKDIKVVGGGYDKMLAAYNAAKKEFDSIPSNQTVDGTRFLVENGNFDEIRKKVEADVENLPNSTEKAAYLEAMNRYLSITQMRNQQISTFDGLTLRLAGLDKARDEWSNKAGQANQTLITLDATNIQTLVDLATGTLEVLRRQMQFQIYQTWRAMDFWAARQEAPPKMSNDFDTLDGVLGLVTTRKQKILQNFGVSPGEIDQILTVLLDETSLKELAVFGKFTLFIKPDDPNFDRKTAVLVNKVTIQFLNEKGQPVLPINYNITHSGYHAFRNAANERSDFVSQERRIRNEVLADGRFQMAQSFAAQGGAQFVENNGDYVGVSPLTRWKIELDGQPLAVLAQIRTVEMRFIGTARG